MEILSIDFLSSVWYKWGTRIVKILLIIIISFAVWKITHILSDKTAQKAKKKYKRKANQRTETVTRVLKSTMGFGVFTVAITLVLDEIGFKIGPLLAAAGVAGVAIGFGAQSLVRDMLNGFFLLLEGQIQVDDWIEAGGKIGKVEDITLRVLSLRDLDGNVHIIPHGEITSITNMTKTYSMMSVDVGVAYKEKTNHVMRVLEEACDHFVNMEDVEPLIRGEYEVLGIQDFADSSVNYKIRVKVKTGEQWNLARIFRRVVKDMFDNEGIEIPFPHRTVFIRKDDVEGS